MKATRFSKLLVVAALALALVPAAALAEGAGTPAAPSPPVAMPSAKGSGWAVEGRPLWRLQLRQGAQSAGGIRTPAVDPLAATASANGGGLRFADDGAEGSATVFGYQYGIGGDEREAVGVTLQVGPEYRDAYERLLLQPGVGYQAPLTSGLHLNARIFSTYATDVASPDRRELSRSGGDPTSGGSFRDIGLGIGLDYSVTPRWVVQTQAGMARQLDDSPGGANVDDGKGVHHFFGGVVVNYRF